MGQQKIYLGIESYWAEGERLFGKDHWKWRYQCPKCEEIWGPRPIESNDGSWVPSIVMCDCVMCGFGFFPGRHIQDMRSGRILQKNKRGQEDDLQVIDFYQRQPQQVSGTNTERMADRFLKGLFFMAEQVGPLAVATLAVIIAVNVFRLLAG